DLRTIMIESANARLAIWIVLTMYHALIFGLEFISSGEGESWWKCTTPFRRRIGPILITLATVILIPFIFVNWDVAQETKRMRCTELQVDADIAGQGVRIAAIIQVSLLILQALLGSFHSEMTGAKETGAGLILTSLSLAIALMVRMKLGALNPVDAAISVMILDGQGIALSIQLTSKETLAARWQVYIAVFTQFITLGTTMALIFKYSEGDFKTHGCQCLTVFYWAWLSSCPPPPDVNPTFELKVFWMYFACRIMCVAQASTHAIRDTATFDRAQKASRDTHRHRRIRGVLKKITFPYFTNYGTAHYNEYPATVTLMFTFYGALALTSLVNAEIAIQNLHIKPSSTVDSTGQVIAIIIAVASVGRALWLLCSILKSQEARLSFMWPWNLHELRSSSRPIWIKPPGWSHRGDFLDIGTLLMDPLDLASKCSSHPQVPATDQTRESEPDLERATPGSKPHTIPCTGHVFDLRPKPSVTVKANPMEQIHFTPSTGYLTACFAEPEIQAELTAGAKAATVFIVTAINIATGLSVTQTTSTGPTTLYPPI
ncbi:hypothetical protein EDB81DRAFT_902067, partial [Dactylonectria macrodidyma]